MNAIINEIIEKLQTAQSPVARIFYKSGNSKLLLIGFKKGMTLEKHKTHVPARLLVLSGAVKYIQEEFENPLKKFDYQDIPVDVFHEVFAGEDSLCMLIKC
jgi:quercetin dioxygenase-like cupin family protein